jgi:hypothetical protein
MSKLTNASGPRPELQIGVARLGTTNKTPGNTNTNPSAFQHLKQAPHPIPPLSQGNTLAGIKAKDNAPLQAMQPVKPSPNANYKSFTLVANKDNAVQLLAMKSDAKLANFPYTRDIDQLPKNCKPADDLAMAAAQDLGIDMVNVKNGRGAVVDAKSGLTATVIVNANDKTIVVSFGGTTSGKKVGEDLMKRSRPGMNFMTTLSQWGANVMASLGMVPKSYKQAVQLVRKVQDEVNASGNYQGYSVRTLGHSKGGGEAMYASMMQNKPLPVTAMCPSHLSKGLIKNIPVKNLGQATTLINSYSPFGDPVSAIRGKMPDVPGIGNGYHFKGIEGSSLIDKHDQFLLEVEHFCRHAH